MRSTLLDKSSRPHYALPQVSPWRRSWARAKRMRLLYLLVLLPMAQLFLFHYVPLYGIVIAFKNYSYHLGFLGSPWNDFAHFKQLFGSFVFWRILKNTVVISGLRLVFDFPAPILFALFLNELPGLRFKKTVQTISYLPHFVSWVVLAGIIQEILSPQRGIVNYMVAVMGGAPVNFLISKAFFRPLLIVTDMWKNVGWGAVIYLASLSSVDPGLYDAASIDGAGRLQKAMHISLPSILPVITIYFILRLGAVLNAGFDQVFNLYNPLVYEVADIIDTYVYRVGLIEARYDYSTAVGLFKNLVGACMVLGSNAVIRRYNEYGIW